MKLKIYQIVIIILAGNIIACTNTSNDNNDDASEIKNDSEQTQLFNGENLEGWYTYQRRPEPTSEVADIPKDDDGNYTEPIGLNNDPLNVFTVVTEDNEPAIRISGETFGILVTKKEFENYHLKLQFKWGELKYPPRKDQKKDSGILYNSVGSEGAWGGVWMKSLECQVQETDCGDYISVDTVLVEIPAIQNEEDNRFYYTPEAELMTFSHKQSYCNKSADFENPMGKWNTMEIYAFGGNSVHLVNGKVNNRVYNARHIVDGKETPLTKGKIQLQSEGAEIFYRNITITPINSIPDSIR